jgi:hypothetical protein
VVSVGAWYDPGQQEPIPLATAAEVDALLDRMLVESTRYDVPVIGQIERGAKAERVVLKFGLRPQSQVGFVGYVGPSGSATSANGADAAEPVAYDHMNHERTVSSAVEIEISLVRQAVHAFVGRDGARPDTITWQSL